MTKQHDWSELVEDILKTIAGKIDFIEDFVRFTAICHVWRSAFVTNLDKSHLSLTLEPLPWLMLTTDSDGDQIVRKFFNPSNNKVYHFPLEEASTCRCWGSPFGWLVTLGLDLQLHLLNPISRERLQLPSLLAFEDEILKFWSPSHCRSYYIKKAVIASIPSDSSRFVVLAIYGEFAELAFARPGDKVWTKIKFCGTFNRDILHFDGRFYSTNSYGHICVFDITSPIPYATGFVSGPKHQYGDTKYSHLVELQGMVYLVLRAAKGMVMAPPQPFETTHIQVYKLDFSARKWEEVKILGDYSIFVGDNTSMSVKISEKHKSKPNCVYFTGHDDDSFLRLNGHDMGIFNLEGKEFETFYECDDMLSRYCPPVWITPKLL